MFKNSSLLMLGSVSAQVIPLLALPILTRVYDPAAIGLQALAISWATAISVVATLRLDLASVLATTETAAERVVHATLTSMLLVVPIVAAALALGSHLVLAMLGHQDAGFWLWLLPILSLAMSLTQLGSAIQIRHKMFARMSLVNLVNQGVTQSLAIGLGMFSTWMGGMVLARVIGQIAAVASLWPQGLWRYVRTWRFSISDYRAVLSECRQFVLFNTPYSLISTVARDAPLIIFGALANAASVGLYGLARVIMFVPTSLASVSLGPVFFREAVDKIGTPALERLAKQLLRLGLFVPAAGFALIAVQGPELFALAFGPDWLAAGQFAAVLAPASWITLQGSWIGRVFEVSGKQRRQFRMQLITDPIVIAAVTGSLLLWGNLLTSVAVFAVLTAAQSCIYFFVAAQVAGFRLADFGREWIAGTGFFVAMVIVLELLTFVPVETLWPPAAFALLVTAAVTLAVVRPLMRTRALTT